MSDDEAAVPIVRTVAAPVPVERALEQDIVEMLLKPAQSTGMELKRLPGSWPKPEQPMVYEGDRSSWLFADYRQDLATLEVGGRVVAPTEAINRLQSLAKAGISCDVVAIAHELPPGWKPGQRLVPAPPKTDRQHQALKSFSKNIAAASRTTGHVAGQAAKGVAVTTGVVIVAGLATAAAGMAVAASAAGAAAGSAASAPAMVMSLDPIVYGGVEQDGYVKWVELARWDW